MARCAYGAPLVAVANLGFGEIRQACCNHWDCPRCGQIRAKQEYRRIVDGAEEIAVEHQLYFWTITCRGRECSLEEAEENYYAWTNILLTNARTKAKRKGDFWAYVQITERQHKTRQHPHSHIVITYAPEDAIETAEHGGRVALVSRWFTRANSTAQLGSQHRISKIQSASAVARYVAKYMFKDSMTEKWPPKWKRVRYSENWPKLKEYTPEFTTVLLTPNDWHQVEKLHVLFVCDTEESYAKARHRVGNILPPGYALEYQIQAMREVKLTRLQ